MQHTRDRFLAGLADGLSVTGAAALAVVNRKTVYDWRHADPEFAAAWEDAVEAGTDKLEDEAWRRAYAGYDKPLVSQGKVVGTYLEYSDTLMVKLLQGRRPQKFKDRVQNEHTGHVGVTAEHKGEFDFNGFSAVFREVAASGNPELATADRDGPDE